MDPLEGATQFLREIRKGLEHKMEMVRNPPSKQSCVKEGRIMVIGPTKFTSLVSGHFEMIQMKEIVVPIEPQKLEAFLNQQKEAGEVQKWQYFVYMVDCDEKVNQDAVIKDLKLLVEFVNQNERSRIDLFYCRAMTNTSIWYPDVRALDKFVVRYDLRAITLRYDVEYCLQETNKAIYSKFVSCATGNFKHFHN